MARGSCLAKEVAILAENMTSASVLLLAGKQDGHQRTNTKDPYAAASTIENDRSQGAESTIYGMISFYFPRKFYFSHSHMTFRNRKLIGSGKLAGFPRYHQFYLLRRINSL